MPDVVADRCAVAKWVLTEADTAKALQVVADVTGSGGRLDVLDLAFPEVANAIWKQLHRGLLTCEGRGVSKPAAEQALAQIGRFRNYGFCKAHAVSYALVAWQEAYLAAHHPTAFWTAVLNNHEGAYPRRVYVEAIKRAGLQVYSPCVNRSGRGWVQEVAGVRTGLSAVRALTGLPVQTILQEREGAGPFLTFADFRRRVSILPSDLALLIRSGAFDWTGRARAVLLREAEATNQGRLHGRWQEVEPWPLDLPAEFSLAAQWQQEWELLGFLPGPPLMPLLRAALSRGLSGSRALPDLVGKRVRLAGLVDASKEVSTDTGPLELITMEDEWGLFDVRLPPTARVSDPTDLGPLVVVEGTVEERYQVQTVVAASLERPLPGGSTAPALPAAAADAKANGAAAQR
jgi:DNA polymerase III alpha subunit